MAQENTFGLGPLDKAISDWETSNNKNLGQALQDSDRGIAAGEDQRNPSLQQMPHVNAGQEGVEQDQQQAGLPGMDAPQKMKAPSLLPPQTMVPVFEAAARKYQVPVNVLMALAQQESNYDPYIRGSQTQWGQAKGMMQYLDSTAKMMGINPYDATQSIDAAAKQIKERLDKGYSMEDAVKEHFAGPDRNLWGPKTAAYGTSVLKKARSIGADLYPDQPTPQQAQEDPNQNSFGTSMSREQYEATFKAMNPSAPPEMLERAMQGWDDADKARQEQQAGAPKAGFERMASPQATFDANLNKKLQGKQNGVVPQLPGRMDGEDARSFAEQDAANRESQLSAAASYLKQSAKAGFYDLAGAGAKVLDEINPFTLSPGDAAVLFKDNPDKLKDFQDQSLTMVLSRFSKAMTKNSEQEMEGISPRAKRDYASKEYATLDGDKSALMSPTRVIGDALRSLPSSLAMAVSVYLTRGAATQAEAQALKAGMTAQAAREAGIQAGARMMGTAGAVSEGGIGYAQQALQSVRDVEKLPDAELAKSPKYQQLLQEGYTPATARAKIAADTGEQAGQIAGIVDATVNKVGGEFLGKVLTEGGKFVPRVLKGFANEAATETAQSAGEQIGQNIATRQNVNPGQALGEGVGEAMAQGAAVGGLMGGTMAGVGGAGHVEGFQPDNAKAQTTPTGPLGRAAQAGEAAAQARRVSVQSEQGNLSGFLESYQAGENGEFVARVLGDDGQVYQFTQADNVRVRPEGQQQPAALPAPTITVGGDGTAMTTDQRQRVSEQNAARDAAQAQRAEQLGLTPDVERAAAAHNERVNLPEAIPDGSTVSVTTRDGEVIEGTVEHYQRTDSSAHLEVKDADGRTWHFKDGDYSDVSVDKPAAGPAAKADEAPAAAQEEAPAPKAAPAPKTEEAAAKPVPAEKPAERGYSDMTDAELQDRLEYLSSQALNNKGWEKNMVREKRKILAEIRNRPQPEAAPEQIDLTGIADRGQANGAMLKAAEQTGKPHEVVEREQGGKTVYDVRPLAEQAMPEAQAPAAAAAIGQAGVQPTDTSVTTGQGKPLVAFENEAGERVLVRKDQFEGGDIAKLPTFGEDGRARVGKAISRDALRSLTEDKPSAPAATPAAEAGKIARNTVDIVRTASGDVDFAKTEKSLPPVKDGFVRLYRGGGESANAFDATFRKDGLADHFRDMPGVSYTPLLKTADYFRESYGKDASVHYVDVPQEAAQRGKIDDTEYKLDVDALNGDARPAPAATSAVPNGEKTAPAAEEPAPTQPKATTKKQSPKARAEAERVHIEDHFTPGNIVTSYSGHDRVLDFKWLNDGLFEAQVQAVKKEGDQWVPNGEPRWHRTQPGRTSRVVEQAPQAVAPAAIEAPPAEVTKPSRFADNKIFTESAVEKARARLKSKLNQLNSGIDPEMLADGITIAGAYVEAGVRDFSQFAQSMVGDFGDTVKPYLLSFYEGVRNWPGLDNKGMTKAKEARRLHAEMLKQEPKEAQHDTQTTSRDAGEGPGRPGAEGQRADEGQRGAGPVSGQPDLLDDAVDQRGQGAGGRAGSEPAAAVPERGNAGADAELRLQGSRGNGDVAGDRANRQPATAARNYRLADGELKREGSWKATAARNVDIIELVKRLESEGRIATADEKALLAKFTGWGASEIANGVFPNQHGQYKEGWRDLGERLKSALTPAEYDQARRTTQYAHYTSEGVIRSIYAGLARLGFKGGSILEPGMGVGHFNGLMPAGMAATSNYTGVEYDGLTGAIAKHLYPESNIIIGDYTKTSLPKDFFDAAIGNPPFASTKITNDPEYKKQGFMLHDYFFAKTMDRVKPGGVVVFVTSKGTMDKASSSARQYLADRANLLGAVRLPQTAFKDNAGTEVVTDVLFLQKRAPGIADNGTKWLDTKFVQAEGQATSVNEYFAAHPDMVLGTHSLTGSQYRSGEYTVLPREGDIEQHFAEALARLPEGVYHPERGSPAERAVVMERDFNPTNKKEGGLYVGDDGRLMQVEDGSGVEAVTRTGSTGKPIALRPAEKAWLKGYVGVRDALKQAQYDQLTDGDWQKSMTALNAAYDDFTAKHGPVLAYSTITRENPDGTTSETKRFKNKSLFEMDAEGALAYALEKIREDGAIEKSVVMRDRVLRRDAPPQIKTTNDALFVSLNNLGQLDLDDVARLGGTTRDDVISALGTAIYEDPSTGWQQADAYLSGNVRRKLDEARTAADINPRYKRNVEALEAVQPRSLAPSEITVRAGANWVPTTDYQAFAKEVLGEDMAVSYTQQTGDWGVTGKEGNTSSEWATTKMTAPAILDAVLNSRQIRITYLDDEKKTHVDAVETEKANDVARKMRERFSRWVWQDGERAARLSDYYNEHFNNIAPRQYDGSHLTLPGVSLLFNLYPHQKRAIWRNIQDGDTYLAHSVGAGKTFTMIASGMEQRRLGLVQRPWFVVPNHMLAQFSREFLELYPAANIMVADEQNFHTSNRRRFLAQASLNDPDAVVLTHSAFGRVGMSEEYTRNYIGRQIDEWQATLDDVDPSERITRKQIERRIEQLERRLEAKAGTDKKDAVMSFEETGADYLYVDEGHEFRKLDFATNQGNIKGVDPSGSQRAMDLQMKVEYLRGKKPGRSITMASGTPVTNTMGELYTVQRFMDPAQMREDGLDTFDAWAAQYGDTVSALEQNAAGGYEAVTRFAKFQNVPELMRRVRSFMDILTSNNLGDLVKRPDVEGGARKIVVTPSPDGYGAYQKELEQRIKAIRQRTGPPAKGDDIILKVIADGRFSAIDMRFVDPAAPADPHSKLNVTMDDMIEAYHQTAGNEYIDAATGRPDALKGSSLIMFTDIGLGEQSAKSRGFNMRDWILQRLTSAGIPQDHIAFMRDFSQHSKKERLFADMREGKKRILIGGKDMETGVNVQKRLSHLFHLDAPWFPASVEQREGRIVRQGNQNQQVSIRAYATKGSYDSTMWGMNARKARFIEQAMNGDDSVRSLDDVSEASSFEMASALASGDERYMKLAGLRGDVERLYRLKQGHYDQQSKMRQDRAYALSRVERFERISADVAEALKQRQPILAGEFSAKVGTTAFDNREEFSKSLFEASKELAANQLDGKRKLGTIGGFDITYYGNHPGKNYHAEVHVDVPESLPILSYPVDPDLAIGGIATRAANQVNGLDERLAFAKRQIDESTKQAEQAAKRIGAPFPEEAELIDKSAQRDALETELETEKNEADVAQPAPAVSDDRAAAPGDDVRYSLAVDGARMQPSAAGVAALREQAPLEIRSTAEQRAADKTDLRNKAFADLAGQRDVLLGHPEIGPIEIGNKGLTKSKGNAADRAKILSMPHLADLIGEGAYMGSKPAEGKGEGIAAYHYIARRTVVDGVPLTALVTLEENANGRVQYYNHTMATDVPGAAPVKTGQVDGELASYRRPDFHPDQAKSKPEALEARHTAVRNALTYGVLGTAFDRLLGSGRVVLHPTEATLPRSTMPKGAAIQGFTDGAGRIHLVAENLTPQTAQPVLLHEAFHAGGEPLAGQERWQKMMTQLQRYYAAAQQRQAEGRVAEGDFWDGALRRVENAASAGVIDPARAAEEFGAYAIENYDLAPNGIRKWIDNVIGMVKDWLARRFGVQLGALTPAQLRAFAVAALHAAQDTVPVQDSTMGGMAFNDGPMSVADKTGKAEALDAAVNSLSEPEPPPRRDFVGNAIRDMEGWQAMYSRFLAHPYHVASLYPEFTPVFQTATAQQQARNAIIEDLHKDHRFYQDLPQESKANVNRVLELGRLTGNSWSQAAVQEGVRNPGYTYTVSFDEEGTPRRVRQDVNAQLSEAGEVIKLNPDEAQAYAHMRAMFDRALDMFRDQALREFGMDQYIGKPDAAAAILADTKGFENNGDARRMQNIAQFINDIEQAKRTGYVPFSRYGDYVVAVKERQANIQYFKDEGYGGFVARGVPDHLDEFLDRIGAQYDAAEQGWRVNEQQRRMLEDENEATVYSEKVETGLRDRFGSNSERNVKKRQGSVSDIPSVQKAIDRVLAEHVGDNENRRIVSFATTKKRGEGGLDMSSLDALAEVAMLDPATWEAVRGQLAKALQAGGFRKHFFQSSNVPGYSADFERSMADYVVGLSGYLARRAHNDQWDKSIAAIKGEKLHQYATKYREYVNQPAEEMALLRQTGFFMYLAGNISTAILNATQVPLMTMPFLTTIASHPLAAGETTRAYKDALAMFRTNQKTGYDLFDFDAAPADIKKDLIRARDEGLLLPLQSLEIMGIAGRRSVEGRALQKGYDQTVQTLALPFTATERLNRIVTFIAANRLAQKSGVQEKIRQTFRGNPLAQSTFGGANFSPYAFAEFAVDETQFRMGKGNRPTAMRGIGTALMQFKSFMLQFLEAMHRNATLHGPRGKMATAATLGMLIALSGVWGAPGAEDLRKLFEGMYKGITKRDLDVRTSLRKMIYDAFGSSWLAGLVDGGLPYTAGADASRRVGLGNIMPDARKATGIDWLDSMISFGGVPADMMVGRPLRAAQQLGRGDVGGAVTQFTPNFIDNARKAYNWQTDGVRTQSGRMVLPAADVKPSSVAMKAIGIQPSQVSDVYSYNEAQRRQQASADELKRQYTSDYVRALGALNRNRDPERTADLQAEVQKIAGEIRSYNEKAAPQDRVTITRSTIKTQLQRELGGSASGKGKERKAARGAAADLREVYGQ